MIKTENLCYVYDAPDGGKISALTDVNFSVKTGEFAAVIGTNGSGKSTLAKHLNALLTPSSGRCLINGLDTLDIAHLWNIRQMVGMVFQNPDNQIVAAVVEEDVAFGPENLGVEPKEIRRRVDEALEIVEMGKYLKHSPHLLSGGQKQRVAIAGVMAMRPKCLVLDEPTAMLDPKGRQEVLSTVRKLNKSEGVTVVYITHFMEEAVTADRIIVMDGGKIIDEGTAEKIFSRVRWLKELGLDAPIAAQVSDYLRQNGVSLPEGIVNDEELVTALCL